MTTSEKPCLNCKRAFPYESTYRTAWNALRQTKLTGFDSADLMAVCWRESLCDGWFLMTEPLFHENLDALREVKSLSIDKFVSSNLTPTQMGNRRISKFRFEPTWFSIVRSDARYADLPLEEQASIACSWGVAQKSGLYLTKQMTKEAPLVTLRAFQRSVDLQMMQLAYDLAALREQAGGNKQLIFTRYNGPENADYVSSYGKIVFAQSVQFRKQLTKMGYSLCST